MTGSIILVLKKKITCHRSVRDITRVHVQKRASSHGDFQISRLHTHRAEQRCRLVCRLLQITRLISEINLKFVQIILIDSPEDKKFRFIWIFLNNIIIQLTEHNIGISTPNKSFGVLPKFPLVSTTWGKISCGNLSKFIMELDQHLMNGSNIPVADALEISVTCFPVQKYRLLILCSSRFLKNSVLINKEIDVQKCRLRLIY